MTSSVVSRPVEYRSYAEDCWKFVNDAADIETKAVFELTAEAWTLLALQVERLEAAHASELIAAPPLLQSAA
jgi:hypothetical protein